MFGPIGARLAPLFRRLVALSRKRITLGAAAIAITVSVGATAALISRQGSVSDRRAPIARTIPSTTSGLAPCRTATATGCDRGRFKSGPDRRGSSACKGRGPATIAASPIVLEEIALIQPMGLMIEGHVTPIDHGYIYIKGSTEKPPRQAAVYSPFNGTITGVSRTARHGGINGDYDDYAVSVDATCTFRVRFSNLVRLAGALADKTGELKPNENATPNLSVKAGELIGYTGLPTAYGIDVWVENDESILTGFINPDQYAQSESWKLHMVDLFENTNEPLKSKLLALTMRDASPRWGKIDYDIDGRLVGTWFRQGSGGYGGNKRGNDGYWDGHLSIVPDGNDPSQIDVSFGNYQGEAKQFAVIGNSPDPAVVSQQTGLVRYELGQIVTYSGDTGQPWDHMSYIPHVRTRAGSRVEGTVLFELTGKRLLKMEIFPGKTAAQVKGFDTAALIYER